MTNNYTENLAEFGYREIKILSNILAVWVESGLPDGFDKSGTKPAMNKQSGFVFLVNDDYQVAMLNGEQLEIFHSLPYNGDEGFLIDLITYHDPNLLHSDDIEYIKYAAEASGIELQEEWCKLLNSLIQ